MGHTAYESSYSPYIIGTCSRAVVLQVFNTKNMRTDLTAKELERRYESYIDTLNLEDWDEGAYTGLARHIEPAVNHNGKILDYAGYARLIPPMTHFVIAELLVDAEKRQLAARLEIAIEGKRVTEHVFYHYSENGKIDRVWSLVQDGQVTGPMGDPRLSSTREIGSPLA